jgi:hypothetical protein
MAENSLNKRISFEIRTIVLNSSDEASRIVEEGPDVVFDITCNLKYEFSIQSI